MTEAITGVLLLLGALLMLLAAVGLMRMPDLLTRMHAATKAGALGAGLMVSALAISFADGEVVARAVAIVAFIVLTAPIAAHMIGRAAYVVGVPLWEHSVKDELQGRYDVERHVLHSGRDDEGADDR